MQRSRIRGQAETFLKPLADSGLFGDGPADSAFHVICDERLNTEHDLAAGQVHMLVSVRASRPSEYRSFLITHGVNGSRVRPVRSNVLPAGVRLSIMTAEAEEAVDVVPEQDVTVDVEAPQPRETRPRPASSPDDPTTPVESLPPASATPGHGEDATPPVAQAPEHGADSTTIVAAGPVGTDDSTTLVLPLSEGAAPGGLDRDDVARFYRDFGGPGQQL